jgi:uncharacterized protein (TIRG00374 family)
MPSKFKKLAQTVFGFLLAAVFLYLAFRRANFADLWKSLQDVDYFWVVLLIPIALISHWLRAVRWAYLLAPVKKDLSQRNLFSAVMIGFMVNNLLPRVGEVARAFAIGRSEGISKSSAFGTVVVERIIDMLTFLLVLCIILFLYPRTLDPFVENVEAVRPFFLAGSVVMLAIFILLFFKGESLFRLLNVVRPLIPRRYRESYQRLVDSFLTGFSVTRRHDTFFVIFVLSLLIYSFYALGLYVPFFALGSLAHHDLNIGAAIILLTISTVAFALPAPGALGTYHTFLTIALVRLYGVDQTTALSYTIITHESGYLLTTVVGLYYFFKDHLKVSDVTLQTVDEKVL